MQALQGSCFLLFGTPLIYHQNCTSFAHLSKKVSYSITYYNTVFAKKQEKVSNLLKKLQKVIDNETILCYHEEKLRKSKQNFRYKSNLCES